NALRTPATDDGRAAVSARLDRVMLGGSDFFVQARSLSDEIDQNLKTTGESTLWHLGWFIGAISALGLRPALATMFPIRFPDTNISAPIERIPDAMDEIVAGNPALTIPERERGDEIGKMARALGVFKDRSEQIEHLQAGAVESARAEAELLAEQQRLQARL